MKTGLFFGSFNPMHIGHKLVASYMVDFTELNQVWFIVSPQNPFKRNHSLLHQHHRLMIIRMEVEDNVKLFASDIELNLSKPSYTIDTLLTLSEKYPENEFSLIIGADNLQHLNKWKKYEQILENYKIYVYPRQGLKVNNLHNNINIIEDCPQIEISASFIRKSIKQGIDVSYLIPPKAWQYIDEMNFYRS